MSDIKAAVHDQFEPVAANYRTSAVHASGADLQRIAQLVAERGAPTVLDVGCGAGHVSVAVAPHSRSVTAYDLTPGMLEQVRRLAVERGVENVRTQQGDVERMPFGDATFDAVVTRYSAHHWPHPLDGVRECLRVLKPGGLLLLSDIVAAEEPGYDTFLQTLELLRDRSHVRDHSISQWQAMFAQCGAAASVDMTWQLPLEFTPWVQRIATPSLNVQVLRALFDNASDDIRQAFDIQPNYQFRIPGALLHVRR